MFTTILVPLDGSPLAEHALPFAERLARSHGARLVLLHVQASSPVREPCPALTEIAARPLLAGLDVETRTTAVPRADELGQAILHDAVACGADLVVLSTHGRGGLGRLLYGSVADQIMRQTTLPLLMVPPGAAAWQADRPLRALVPLDGSALAEAVLVPLAALLSPLPVEVTLLQVVTAIDYVAPHGDDCALCRAAREAGGEPDIAPVRARQYLDEVTRRIDAPWAPTCCSLVSSGPAAPTIARIAAERSADLIALATRGRGGLSRAVLGSTALDTLRRAGAPLFLVRPEATQDASSLGVARA
ncbi:MAG: universal stress protein [Chloroflexi bacterium]|nr:universal stress protein [Chloroflexota bacterium]